MIQYAKTKYGTLESVKSNAGFALFRGVRYAKPPVGQLRFAPPQEPDSWEGVIKCDTYGAVAPQGPLALHDETGRLKKVMPGYPYPPKIDEDCLFLNVYTPAEDENAKLPVMFYIHGGGFQNWYGSCYEYCGDGLASHGVVVVTINYRMNVFGFFAHPDLKKESPSGCCGNYGILDQVQALRWVRENIASFGGDPDNITIFGQSAGAMSVQALACSPLTKGWFKHAAMHSGGGLFAFAGRPQQPSMAERSVKFLEFCGCGSIEELRAMPWETLEQHTLEYMQFHNETFSLEPDGYVLPKSVEECLQDGTMQHVDYLFGCTVDEGIREMPQYFASGLAPAVRALAYAMKEKGYQAPYVYCFDRPQPGDDIGTPHSCDNRYVFCSLAESWRPYDESDYALSEQMMNYWTNFAKTGDPNGEGISRWEPFGENGLVLRLSTQGCAMTDLTVEGDLAQRTEKLLELFHQ